MFSTAPPGSDVANAQDASWRRDAIGISGLDSAVGASNASSIG